MLCPFRRKRPLRFSESQRYAKTSLRTLPFRGKTLTLCIRPVGPHCGRRGAEKASNYESLQIRWRVGAECGRRAQPAQDRRGRTQPVHRRLGHGKDHQRPRKGLRGVAAGRPRRFGRAHRRAEGLPRRHRRGSVARSGAARSRGGALRGAGARGGRHGLPPRGRGAVVRHDRGFRRADLHRHRLGISAPCGHAQPVDRHAPLPAHGTAPQGCERRSGGFGAAAARGRDGDGAQRVRGAGLHRRCARRHDRHAGPRGFGLLGGRGGQHPGGRVDVDLEGRGRRDECRSEGLSRRRADSRTELPRCDRTGVQRSSIRRP